MSRPYDASLKELVESYPADWLALAGFSVANAITVIDADLSTITAAADKVLRIEEGPSWLLHFELQSSPKSDSAEQAHWYNTLLRHRHRLRVRSVLVLLRPEADSPRLTGLYQEQFADEPPYLEFRYQVLRVWRVPVERILKGGLGTLPLAPVSAVAEADLPGVARTISQRLAQEATPEEGVVLEAATVLLTGLRLPADKIIQLYQGANFMSVLKDSSIYQWILAEGLAEGRAQGRAQGQAEGRVEGETMGKKEGAIEELRKILLRLGEKRFGPADPATQAALAGITDLDRLERMSERMLVAAGWEELLATV